MVEEAAAEAGKTADRRQWRTGRDVSVARTPEVARARAVLGGNYVQHQLPNRKGQD